MEDADLQPTPTQLLQLICSISLNISLANIRTVPFVVCVTNMNALLFVTFRIAEDADLQPPTLDQHCLWIGQLLSVRELALIFSTVHTANYLQNINYEVRTQIYVVNKCG